MNELGFGDRECEAAGRCPAAEGPVVSLEKLDIPAVGRGSHCDDKVVHIGEDCPFLYYWVEWGNVEDEQQWEDRGALGGADSHRSEDLRRALEQETTLPVGEEAADPRGQVFVGALSPEERS